MYCAIPQPIPGLLCKVTGMSGKIGYPDISHPALERDNKLLLQKSYAHSNYAFLKGTNYEHAIHNYMDNMRGSQSEACKPRADVERRTRAGKKNSKKDNSRNSGTDFLSVPGAFQSHTSATSSGERASPVSFCSLPEQGKDLTSTRSLAERGCLDRSTILATTNSFRPANRYKNGAKTPGNSVNRQPVETQQSNETSGQQSQYLNWKKGQNAAEEALKSKTFKMEKSIEDATRSKALHPKYKQNNQSGRIATPVPRNAEKPERRPKTEKESILSRPKLNDCLKESYNQHNKTCHNNNDPCFTKPHLNGYNINKNSNKINAFTEEQYNPNSTKKKTFLDLYEVFGVIGVGGGGMVYAGRRTTDSHPVAIKRIMREKVKRWEKIQGRNVPQEIGLMVRVNGHPGIIKLLDWYECLDSFILILERPKNSVDLFDYIREVGHLNEKEGCMIFKQVITAMHHIHARGVVHRDIKDENIVLNRDTGESKIIDFGCGTLLHDHCYRDFSGTPEFYPPEWFNEHYYNARPAAIWSLGVLLYDMLSGEIPFKSKSRIALGKFEFKGSTTLSHEAKHLISWMLSIRPEARPSLIDVIQHPWVLGKKF